MSDALRRLFGLSGERDQGRRNDDQGNDKGTDNGNGEPYAPELAPGAVLVDGRTSASVVALRVTIVVVAVLLLLIVLLQLQQLVMMVIVALIIGAAMHSPVHWLERRGAPRVLAILLAYGALLAVILAVLVAIGGPLAAQAQQLFENLPEIVDDLRTQFAEFTDGILGAGRGEELLGWFDNAVEEMDFGPLLRLPLQVVEVLANAIIVFFLSAFLVWERDRARDWLLPLLPPDKREPAHRLAQSVLRRLARFIHGQLLLMTFVGTGMTVALLVLGIPFALPLGLFAFLVEAIPMIGPWLAIIPAAAVAFTESPEQALILIVFWTIIQQLEGYVLTPAVMGKVQHLPPSVVLLSVIAGFHLFGIIGAVIAVPVVAATAMIVEGVFVAARREALNDSDPPKRVAKAGESGARPKRRRRPKQAEEAG